MRTRSQLLSSLLTPSALLLLVACGSSTAVEPVSVEPVEVPAAAEPDADVNDVDVAGADAAPDDPGEPGDEDEAGDAASDGVSGGGSAEPDNAPAATEPSSTPDATDASADAGQGADPAPAGGEAEPPADAVDDGSADAVDEASADAADGEPEPAAPEPAQPVQYTLGNGSYAAVLVKYDRNATIKGHDHVLVAQTVKGSVTWTPGEPSACQVSVTIPASSLTVDPPGSRARSGLEGETSDGDKRKIRENALGKSQLEADKYPDLTFRSTSCTADGDRVKVTGDLTLHGRSKRVTTRMRITADPDSFRARGSVSATHSDFGMKPFTALLGALRNDESLTFDLDFKGKP